MTVSWFLDFIKTSGLNSLCLKGFGLKCIAKSTLQLVWTVQIKRYCAAPVGVHVSSCHYVVIAQQHEISRWSSVNFQSGVIEMGSFQKYSPPEREREIERGFIPRFQKTLLWIFLYAVHHQYTDIQLYSRSSILGMLIKTNQCNSSPEQLHHSINKEKLKHRIDELLYFTFYWDLEYIFWAVFIKVTTHWTLSPRCCSVALLDLWPPRGGWRGRPTG